MEKQLYGIVLKVNDLDACRIFYRELFLPLVPVMDSSFAVVFNLTSDLTFTIEKSAAPYLEHSSSATSWRFDCADFAALQERLLAIGYEFEPEPSGRESGYYWRTLDPEGNLVVVRQLQVQQQS